MMKTIAMFLVRVLVGLLMGQVAWAVQGVRAPRVALSAPK